MLIGAVGLAAIGAAVVRFSSATAFPGMAAVLPVLGTALVIVAGAGAQSNPFSRVLSNGWLVAIGLISYPMYLWHWPLIAFAHLLHYDPTRLPIASGIFVATVVLSVITYRFAESPVRNRAVLATPKALLAASGMTAMLLTAFGVHAWLTLGASYRFSPDARGFLTAPFAARSQRCGFTFRVLHPNAQTCMLRSSETNRRVLLWGNSHGDMWSGLFDELAKTNGVGFYLNARNCRATIDNSFCGKQVQDSVLGDIDRMQITDVVLASTGYGSYDVPDAVFETELRSLVNKLTDRGVRTWLVVDTPGSRTFDPIVAYESNHQHPIIGELPLRDYAPKHDRERGLFQSLSVSPLVRIIDPSTALCDATTCHGGVGSTPWYRDTAHLTDAGARVASAGFEPVFLPIAPAAPTPR
jgi:hypothetical protein